ncbi:putative exported protein [Burkholderia pseudomallei 406e]|uniref:Uncharacterized protein n=2 Tax=Burkholderia pseudomallei TaxID=28450 RepID=A0A0E1W1S0_BURPE|nr:hypothetical protein BURPS668_2006 [Burkholderia pseudomallei 668]ABN89532.1 hypothetical protein BURPS1106A_2026 [Burkholderia pseudomallei 1106a]ACQ98237.1 conserved hypothetical protein [Burkholderia pseudomallei MSHR346]AFR15944.1 hypothetical protein BPC006_I2074 [Burkholderia pseudomallei BPC006]EBA50919.1 hypothetical protein BURPS305_6610 [Burkholderia pseudomallei 305]EDO84530.1 putative exported protein [Burkholderia pseudomallei 406e]EDO92188.1 hypothetical protein BURPSPAST_AA0
MTARSGLPPAGTRAHREADHRDNQKGRHRVHTRHQRCIS